MLVKICGIKTIETADVAVQAGADLIGFVFAPSSRQITPNEAAAIARTVPHSVKKVGVFVNESVSYMVRIAEHVGLDMIQLHGDEPPSIIKELPYQTMKAFSIDKINDTMIHSYSCDYYLIDSPAKKYRGGSGQTFDWTLVSDLPIHPSKIMLAGGLTPENVQTAIDLIKPAGVDVSSGVETNGEKDHAKIKRFIANAKG